MPSLLQNVEFVEWTCDKCGKPGSFSIDGQKLCGDHWRLTPHYIGLRIDEVIRGSQGSDDGDGDA